MEISQGKVFYKPEQGMYNGTVIDVAEFPKHPTAWGPTDKVLIQWAITTPAGQLVVGPDGEPVFASAFVKATMSDKSTQPLFRNLYKLVQGIIGGQPPLITSAQQLETLLLGRSNGLMVTKEPNPNKVGDFYSNIVAIMPLAPGAVVPQAPAGFKRKKDQPKTQAGPQGQPVQTYSQPPQAAPVSVPAGASAATSMTQPTAEQIAAFLAAQAANKPNVGF